MEMMEKAKTFLPGDIYTHEGEQYQMGRAVAYNVGDDVKLWFVKIREFTEICRRRNRV